MKTDSVTLFRHGQSRYVQGNHLQTLASACDLCAKQVSDQETPEQLAVAKQEAIDEVRASVTRLALTLSSTSPVHIISSPVGRTLHTSKVIKEALREYGFNVFTIETDELLGEVAGFSWALFEPLMNGGTVSYIEDGQEKKFEIDKSDTNPYNSSYPDYFIRDSVHRISESVKATWPEVYRTQVEGFEKFRDVTNRFLVRIRQLAYLHDVPNAHLILVTHDCGAMHLASQFTTGKQKGLVPGTYISIDRRTVGRGEAKLVVTRVGDITEGDSEEDFFETWFKHNEYKGIGK